MGPPTPRLPLFRFAGGVLPLLLLLLPLHFAWPLGHRLHRFVFVFRLLLLFFDNHHHFTKVLVSSLRLAARVPPRFPRMPTLVYHPASRTAFFVWRGTPFLPHLLALRTFFGPLPRPWWRARWRHTIPTASYASGQRQRRHHETLRVRQWPLAVVGNHFRRRRQLRRRQRRERAANVQFIRLLLLPLLRLLWCMRVPMAVQVVIMVPHAMSYRRIRMHFVRSALLAR